MFGTKYYTQYEKQIILAPTSTSTHGHQARLAKKHYLQNLNLEATSSSKYDHSMGKNLFCTHLKSARPMEKQIQLKSRSQQ